MIGVPHLEHQRLIPRIGLSPHLYVHHNAADMFGHKCTTTSHQYKVNLGQPKVNLGKGTLRLPKATLWVIKNLTHFGHCKPYGD